MRPLLLLLALTLLSACSPRYDKAKEESAQEAAVGAYIDRVISLAKSYAKSDESAINAADAAIAGAGPEFRAMEDQTIRWYAIMYRDGTIDARQGRKLAAECREENRERAIALIMQMRLDAKVEPIAQPGALDASR